MQVSKHHNLMTILNSELICLGSSYGKCRQDYLEGKLLSWLGCLPPWFPTQSNGDKM